MFCKIVNDKIVNPSNFDGEKEFKLDYDEYINNQTKYIYDVDKADIIVNPNFETEQLATAKATKLQENINKRDARLIAGVTYKNILFDSDQDQKINLSATASNMSDTDTITWYGKDGVSSLSCTKSDIENIGKLIISLTQNVWANINPMYVNKINACKTIDEVNAIVIDYSVDA